MKVTKSGFFALASYHISRNDYDKVLIPMVIGFWILEDIGI